MKRFGWLAAAVVALALALVACAPLPTRGLRASSSEIAEVAGHPAPLPSTTGFAPGNATPAQRAETVDRIWRTIDTLYYDPTFNGIDVAALRTKTIDELPEVRSDAQFYRVLKRNVRALRDSHTLVLTPREAEDARVHRATQIGLVFAISEARVVVASVVADFPADRAGVRAGMIVDAIDGETLDEAFFERKRAAPSDPSGTEPSALGAGDAERLLRLRALRALLVADDGVPRPHRMMLRRADDTLLDVEVEARVGDVPVRASLDALPSGIDVLKLSRFDSAVRAQLARDIETSRGRSRGLVVDLRGNPGGEQRLYEWLVSRFVDRRVKLLEAVRRSGDRRVVDDIESSPAERPYLKPVAVLIDRGTGSAAELTAHTLVEQRKAIAVGEATCGCVVAVRYDYLLPDGGALRVAQVGFRTARGRRMEADPLLPDIAIVPTLAERRAGRDPALEAAERALLALPP